MKLIKALIVPAMLVACIAQPSAAFAQGGSISGSVAEYNAGQLILNHDLLTVPSGMVTYTANTTIPVGTLMSVSLPADLKFTTPTLPSLSSSAATFSLVNVTGNTATFTVTTSTIAASDTIVLGEYDVKDAHSLETITPVASALPLTMQAIGIDPQPLSFPEFASDSGIQAVFVGAIQFIDLTSPSNGSKFGTGGSNDSSTAVISAIAIQPEVVDFLNGSTHVLSPNGTPNTLASYDTARVVLPGALFGNVKAFSSYSSNCESPIAQGKVTSNALIFPNTPLNQEIFFCVKATGNKMVEMIGFPGEGFVGPGPGFTTVQVAANHPYDDYLPSSNVNVEFPGLLCYTYAASFGGACIDEYFNLLGPGSDPEVDN
jgi:hypothetical protein